MYVYQQSSMIFFVFKFEFCFINKRDFNHQMMLSKTSPQEQASRQNVEHFSIVLIESNFDRKFISVKIRSIFRMRKRLLALSGEIIVSMRICTKKRTANELFFCIVIMDDALIDWFLFQMRRKSTTTSCIFLLLFKKDNQQKEM